MSPKLRKSEVGSPANLEKFPKRINVKDISLAFINREHIFHTHLVIRLKKQQTVIEHLNGFKFCGKLKVTPALAFRNDLRCDLTIFGAANYQLAQDCELRNKMPALRKTSCRIWALIRMLPRN